MRVVACLLLGLLGFGPGAVADDARCKPLAGVMANLAHSGFGPPHWLTGMDQIAAAIEHYNADPPLTVEQFDQVFFTLQAERGLVLVGYVRGQALCGSNLFETDQFRAFLAWVYARRA